MSSWHDTVRANLQRTTGIVVAESGECLRIQQMERDLVPGRTFRPVLPADLSGTQFGDSWFAGVLLCPGDGTQTLAVWAQTLPNDAVARIRFYYLRATVLREALAAWNDGGLPDRPKSEVHDFRSFHRLFGRHYAEQVFLDAERRALASPNPATVIQE